MAGAHRGLHDALDLGLFLGGELVGREPVAHGPKVDVLQAGRIVFAPRRAHELALGREDEGPRLKVGRAAEVVRAGRPRRQDAQGLAALLEKGLNSPANVDADERPRILGPARDRRLHGPALLGREVDDGAVGLLRVLLGAVRGLGPGHVGLRDQLGQQLGVLRRLLCGRALQQRVGRVGRVGELAAAQIRPVEPRAALDARGGVLGPVRERRRPHGHAVVQDLEMLGVAHVPQQGVLQHAELHQRKEPRAGAVGLQVLQRQVPKAAAVVRVAAVDAARVAAEGHPLHHVLVEEAKHVVRVRHKLGRLRVCQRARRWHRRQLHEQHGKGAGRCGVGSLSICRLSVCRLSVWRVWKGQTHHGKDGQVQEAVGRGHWHGHGHGRVWHWHWHEPRGCWA